MQPTKAVLRFEVLAHWLQCSQEGLPYNRAMTIFTSPLALQRRIWAALAAWLCIVVVSGVSPWLRGPAAAHAVPVAVMEQLCSGSGDVQWVPSAWEAEPATADVHEGMGHEGWACALCLPAMALSGAWSTGGAAWLPVERPVVHAAAQRVAVVAQLPPARGPPRG